jgi:hypothetical protein
VTRAALFASLAGLGVLGVWAEWAMPAGAPSDLASPPHIVLPVPSAPHASPPDEAALANAIGGLNQRPLFRPDRKPPRPAPEPAPPTQAADAALPRLAGVVVGPAGRRAIFAGADGKPAVAVEGGSLGRFTVKTITPGRVTLFGPEGDIDLRPTFLKATP